MLGADAGLLHLAKKHEELLRAGCRYMTLTERVSCMHARVVVVAAFGQRPWFSHTVVHSQLTSVILRSCLLLVCRGAPAEPFYGSSSHHRCSQWPAQSLPHRLVDFS